MRSPYSQSQKNYSTKYAPIVALPLPPVNTIPTTTAVVIIPLLGKVEHGTLAGVMSSIIRILIAVPILTILFLIERGRLDWLLFALLVLIWLLTTKN